MDLRDNKGGSVEDAFSIFSMFVKTGKFASMTGIDGKTVIKERLSVSKTKLLDKNGHSTKIRSREKNLSRARPLLVLVDGKTRSAAEMLAGALRDSAGAKIIGTKTYGKGVIQRVWEFDNNTSVKITSGAYKLPSGATIHGVGIKPAIKIASVNTDRPIQLATRLLREVHAAKKQRAQTGLKGSRSFATEHDQNLNR
jgi:C-terminal peptidase prc